MSFVLSGAIVAGISVAVTVSFYRENAPSFIVSGQNVTKIAAAPARPGHIAEREELDSALARGTREAVQLFIDRHPDSRYRSEAEEFLRQRSRSEDKSSIKPR